MTAEDIVRQYFSLMGENRGRDALALLADDVSYRVIGATPISGEAVGVTGVLRDLIGPFTSRLQDRKIVLVPDEFIASGNTVVVLAHSIAASTSGTPYNNEYAMVFRVAHDRIASIVEYLDTVLIETAIFGKQLVEVD